MISVVYKLDKSDALATFGVMDAFIKGKVVPLPTEKASSLEAYISDLKSEFETSKAAASDTELQNPQNRAKMAYAAAIYRDSMYALANRKRILGLGLNNSYREVYQIGKIGINATYSPRAA